MHAHRVDGDAVGAVLVAAADPAAGRHGGRLGDADQLEGEVAVGPCGWREAVVMARMVTAGTAVDGVAAAPRSP